jgi:hypothetical protein
MNEHPTDEERQAMIAGDRAGELEPDEAAELEMFADILADPSTWAEPSAGLEDNVVRAVQNAPRATTAKSATRTRARRGRMLVAVAAAAAIVVLALAGIGVFKSQASPDYRAALSGTPLAPNARASADVNRNDAGFRITLDAHGLPKLPAGEYYQAWLKNGANVLVPIGTFSSSDGRITLWSGVSPQDFPTITVTIERADNDQGSSGRRVLIGVAHVAG